jgi:hypothetical protein
LDGCLEFANRQRSRLAEGAAQMITGFILGFIAAHVLWVTIFCFAPFRG